MTFLPGLEAYDPPTQERVSLICLKKGNFKVVHGRTIIQNSQSNSLVNTNFLGK